MLFEYNITLYIVSGHRANHTRPCRQNKGLVINDKRNLARWSLTTWSFEVEYS